MHQLLALYACDTNLDIRGMLLISSHHWMVPPSKPWTLRIPPSESGLITDPSFWINDYSLVPSSKPTTQHWTEVPTPWCMTTKTINQCYEHSLVLFRTAYSPIRPPSQHKIMLYNYDSPMHKHTSIQEHMLIYSQVFTQLLKHVNFIRQLIKHSTTTTKNH